MLNVNSLKFEYLKNIPVLQDISFNVEEGELCGLFGPNGCGKTTLFKCCLKFLKYQKGKVSVDEHDIKERSVKDMAKLVAYVPQEHKPSFPYLVRDVVLMGRTPHLRGVFNISSEDKKKTIEAMKLVGIDGISNFPYNQLSGGQRQLVIIARAVAQDTKMLFLDEPTSALDFSNQIKIWKLLRKITHNGTTIIACTHDPNHVMWFCDQVVVMDKNKIITNGPPEKIITEKVLDEIYTDICSIKDLYQTKMVYPKDVATLKNNSKNSRGKI
jgi:iron complex transport system ATP-binding protein